MVEMTSGIYWFYQPSQDRAIYVGSSNNMKLRIANHRAALRHGKHQNPKLQNTWNKYGESDFQIDTLEECDVSLLVEREKFWMNLMPIWSSCNRRCSGDSAYPSEDTKRRWSEQRKGRIPWNKGLTYSGSPRSEETKRKMSIAATGRVMSPEAIRKMVNAKKGKKHTAEARANMSAALKGHKVTEQTRAKISETLMGHPVSQETLTKIAETKRRKAANQIAHANDPERLSKAARLNSPSTDE